MCKERILKALEQTNPNWTRKTTINNLVNNQSLARKYTGETIGRELRRLARQNIIGNQKKGKYVQYRRYPNDNEATTW